METTSEQFRPCLRSIRTHILSLLYSFRRIDGCMHSLPGLIDSIIYDYLSSKSKTMQIAVINKMVITNYNTFMNCEQNIILYVPKILRYISKRINNFINCIRAHQEAKPMNSELLGIIETINEKLVFRETNVLEHFNFVAFIKAKIIKLNLNKTFFKKDFQNLINDQCYYDNLEALLNDFQNFKKLCNTFNENIMKFDKIVFEFITEGGQSFKQSCYEYTTVGLMKALIADKVNFEANNITLITNKTEVMNNNRLISDYSPPFLVIKKTNKKCYFHTPISKLSKTYNIDKTIKDIKKDLEITLKKEVDIILDYEYLENNVKLSSLDIDNKWFIVEYANMYKFILPDKSEINIQFQHFQTFYDVYQNLFLNYLSGNSFALFINDVRVKNFEEKVCDVNFDFIVVKIVKDLSTFVLFPNNEIRQFMFNRNDTVQDVKNKISKKYKKNFIISVDDKKLIRMLIPVLKIIGDKNNIIKVNKIEDNLIYVNISNREILEFTYNNKTKIKDFIETLKTIIKCNFKIRFNQENITDETYLSVINPPVINVDVEDQEYTIIDSNGKKISIKLSPTSEIRDLKQTISKIYEIKNDFNIEIDDRAVNTSAFLFNIEPDSKIQIKECKQFKVILEKSKNIEKIKTIEKTISLSTTLTINELKSMISKSIQVDTSNLSVFHNNKILSGDLRLKEFQDSPTLKIVINSFLKNNII